MKWYGKYGIKANQIVKRFGKIQKKIVKRYEKYGNKLWNDRENMEENQVE